MLKNIVLIGIRNLGKNKLFSFVNVFGLSLSMAVCLLIIAVILDQNSFDLFHPNPENTYRVNTLALRKNGGTELYASTPFPLAAILQSEHPFIAQSLRLNRSLRGSMVVGERKLTVGGYFTEPTFFAMFGFQLSGCDANALNDPKTLIISEETAEKFFGNDNPIGKSVAIENMGEFQVRGIVKKTDQKTHVQFDILGSLVFLQNWQRETNLPYDSWKNYYHTHTYVTLRSDARREDLQAALDALPQRVYAGMELESRDADYKFEIQRMDEITPGPMMSASMGEGMPTAVLIFLSVLAGIGMFAAAFNYANLTLARSITRAREIGVRKVAGATRINLIGQFIGESVVVAFVSLLVAEVLLHVFMIPAFQSLSFSADMKIKFDPTFEMYAWSVLFTMIVGMVSGLIPAWILSSFKPAAVVKDISKIRFASGLTLRKLILIVQFAMTLVLLIVLTTISRQTDFAFKMDYYGFDWRNTVNVKLAGPNAHAIAAEMAQYPGVQSYAFASHTLGTWEDSDIDVQVDPTKEAIAIRDYSIDENFTNIMNLSVIAGEGFHHNTKEADQILVNEKFVEWMQAGSNADAIGKTVYLDKNKPVTISGVVKDFVFKPLAYELEPMVFRYDPAAWSIVHFKLKNSNTKDAGNYFEQVWKKFDPSTPLVWQAYIDELTGVYTIFGDLVRIIGSLAIMVLIIAMLGLLGAVSFSVETRTKEIGIRKVMGATSGNIVRLLSKQYVILILIAAAIGLPLSYLITDQLLRMFAYRIEFGIGLFLPAILMVGIMVAITVGSQALKGANENPVKALRYE